MRRVFQDSVGAQEAASQEAEWPNDARTSHLAQRRTPSCIGSSNELPFPHLDLGRWSVSQ